MRKGEITAFLSMVFVLLVSFVLGILEISLIRTSAGMSRVTADRAVFSLFGGYQKALFEDYHVFALDGSFGSGPFSEEQITGRLHYYGSPEISHEITGVQFLTDGSGQAFREQVLEYMETRYGVSLIRDFTGLTGQWEEECIQGEEMKAQEESVMADLEELRTDLSQAWTAGEARPEVGQDAPEEGQDAPEEGQDVSEEGQDVSEDQASLPEGNPFGCLEQIEKSGVLSLVMPEEMELSGLEIEQAGQASVRSLASGSGTFPHRQGMDGLEEKLLFNEYVLKTFGNAVSAQEEEDGSPGRTLSYEAEYILGGKASDRENLEAVLLKIFFIRMAMNYIYLLGDSAKRGEATALAAVIAAALLIPEGTEVIEQLILVAWAAGESIVDIRTLLGGKRAALMKSADTWQVSLASLLTLGSGADGLSGEDAAGGISYEDYLRIFLFFGNTDEVTMRTVDRVEENLASEHGLSVLRADQCVTKIELLNTSQTAGGITYTFPLYFGYC